MPPRDRGSWGGRRTTPRPDAKRAGRPRTGFRVELGVGLMRRLGILCGASSQTPPALAAQFIARAVERIEAGEDE